MGRSLNSYKNRPSGYSLAYVALCKTYNRMKKPLTLVQAEESFESTPGLSFSPGTRTEDVIKTLLEWKVIAKFTPVGHKESQIVPLELKTID